MSSSNFFRFGSPLWQGDEDVDIDFPSGPSTEGFILSTAEHGKGFDVFQSYCKLSIIKSKVCKHLYSVITTEPPVSDLARSVAKLDQMLGEWKECVPKEYRPDVQSVPACPKLLDSVLLLSLHFSYLSCLIAVHRLGASPRSNVNVELSRSSSSDLLTDEITVISATLCQNAARVSIRLLKYMPEDNPFFVGYVSRLRFDSVAFSGRFIC